MDKQSIGLALLLVPVIGLIACLVVAAGERDKLIPWRALTVLLLGCLYLFAATVLIGGACLGVING